MLRRECRLCVDWNDSFPVVRWALCREIKVINDVSGFTLDDALLYDPLQATWRLGIGNTSSPPKRPSHIRP